MLSNNKNELQSIRVFNFWSSIFGILGIMFIVQILKFFILKIIKFIKENQAKNY